MASTPISLTASLQCPTCQDKCQKPPHTVVISPTSLRIHLHISPTPDSERLSRSFPPPPPPPIMIFGLCPPRRITTQAVTVIDSLKRENDLSVAHSPPLRANVTRQSEELSQKKQLWGRKNASIELLNKIKVEDFVAQASAPLVLLESLAGWGRIHDPNRAKDRQSIGQVDPRNHYNGGTPVGCHYCRRQRLSHWQILSKDGGDDLQTKDNGPRSGGASSSTRARMCQTALTEREDESRGPVWRGRILADCLALPTVSAGTVNQRKQRETAMAAEPVLEWAVLTLQPDTGLILKSYFGSPCHAKSNVCARIVGNRLIERA
ncbi:hypothetical protein BC827DRAFT_1304326 [Russula dissimulans]|nr:hypothetical protein BC827DRAFT_1304326 [Russula dissimulans]